MDDGALGPAVASKVRAMGSSGRDWVRTDRGDVSAGISLSFDWRTDEVEIGLRQAGGDPTSNLSLEAETAEAIEPAALRSGTIGSTSGLG